MPRAVDVAIIALISFIVVVAAFLSIPAKGSTAHFGFPSYSAVSKLLTGENLPYSQSMQNSTLPGLSNEYGLVRAQSAFYTSNGSVAPALPAVYITELNFNNQMNASSFYSAQYFSSIAASQSIAARPELNISYVGASYSIFPIVNASQEYYFIVGYLGNFGFALFLYSAQVPQGSPNSLAELVVQSMN